jgi:hypothetical protein
MTLGSRRASNTCEWRSSAPALSPASSSDSTRTTPISSPLDPGATFALFGASSGTSRQVAPAMSDDPGSRGIQNGVDKDDRWADPVLVVDGRVNLRPSLCD